MYPTQFTHEQYKKKLTEVTDLATTYAKTGKGYTTMREAFNELFEGAGANHCCGNDLDMIKQGRRIIANRVATDALAYMPVNINRRLLKDLIHIAETDVPQVRRSGGFRR